MKILKFALGQLQANCYFLIKENDYLIIDPADDAPFILEELQRRRLILKGMLATHGHFDHIMAAGEIQLSFDVPLFINDKDRFLVSRLKQTAEHFLKSNQTLIVPETLKHEVNSSLLSDFQLKIMETPGHTPGGRSFYIPSEKIIFTGDTLFKGAIGRFDHSYCDKNDLRNSLIKMSELPGKVKVYPGHEEETTIKEQHDNLLHYINIMK